MARVEVRNGNVEMAIKKFKQKVSKDGIPQEVKKRGFYEKPGIKRRKAKKEGIKNTRKNNKNRRD